MSPLTLGSTIRERRRELGLRQAELAELAGVSTRFVGELEHGKQTAQLDKFHAVVSALGLVMELRLRNGQGS
jgi:HTH-type transcriptional regulator/antitoxin HipB